MKTIKSGYKITCIGMHINIETIDTKLDYLYTCT